MARRIRAHDWAATSLGPIEQWPQSRKSTVELILGSGHAMQLALGSAQVVLYNDAYAPMLGGRHPQALGMTFPDAWPDIWPEIEPLVRRVFEGETLKFDDMPLVMHRHGYAEDTWWNFSYSPVRDEGGAVVGLLNVTVDTTPSHRNAQARRESDEKFRVLFDSIDEGFCTIQMILDDSGAAVDFLLLEVNQAYERHTGLRGVVGKKASEIFPRMESWLDLFASVAFSGKAARMEYQVEQLGRWYTAYVSPFGPKGSLQLSLVFNDITERRHAETQLRESELYKTFLLKFNDALRQIAEPSRVKTVATTLIAEQLGVNRAFYADAENNHWIVTPGYERGVEPLPLMPFSMSEYGDWIIAGFRLGQPLVVGDMSTDPRFNELERQAHLALQIRSEVALPLVKDDALVAMLVVQATEPRTWSEHNLALLTDAAERTWSAVERARAEAALLTANRRKDEFLAVLAHELRNGLAPLVYNVEIANRSMADATLIKELSARSGRQLAHMVRLVDDLLDVARITTGKIELSIERVITREIVNMALDACRVDVDRKRHRLTVVDEVDAGVAVRGDRVRLTQVVSNLLSNATKYMEPGGTITVRIARDGDAALIEVSDTGIGIPSAALPQVFDLFTQVRNQQTYSAGGLGIGLSLVKQLVEMQGGQVTAESAGLGRGSTFTVRLPVVTANEANDQVGTPQADEDDRQRALRVLVVDDQRDAADTLSQLLCLLGHDAQPAYGGAHALEHAKARRPDLVLLDLGMPGMDGFEVAGHLRAEFSNSIQIVALTGWGQETDRQQTRAASFDAHLAKPPTTAELQAILTAAPRMSM